MKLIIRLVINVLALLIVEYIIPGFHLASIWTAVVAAVIIGVVNTFIKPILQLVTLPISILTLGLSAFLLNVFLLWSVTLLVPGFTIDSFMTALIASILLTLITWFLHKLAND